MQICGKLNSGLTYTPQAKVIQGQGLQLTEHKINGYEKQNKKEKQDLSRKQIYNLIKLHWFFYMRRYSKIYTRVGTLIVATINLQLIQNRYMFRSFPVLQCSHQNCVQPVASDVEVAGYL